MKTALQELIDELKDYKKTTFSDKLVVTFWILKAEKLLEKEKEQIKKAREDGFDAYAEHKGLLTHEQYYNKTYNI